MTTFSNASIALYRENYCNRNSIEDGLLRLRRTNVIKGGETNEMGCGLVEQSNKCWRQEHFLKKKKTRKVLVFCLEMQRGAAVDRGGGVSLTVRIAV